MFRYVSIIFALFCQVALSSQPAYSQTAPPESAHRTRALWPDSVISLPDLTIVATRFRIHTLDSPSLVTVLDSSAFRDFRSQSVSDVLGRHSGIFVRQYGPGGLASLSARGTTSSQSVILLDGLPLVNPQLGQFDLNLLPRQAFRSAEVLSGAAAAQYGSAATGSVVNLRTNGAVGRSASIEVQSGSFGERGFSGGWSLMTSSDRVGMIGASVSMSLYGTDGDFPYVNVAAFPVETVRRENADVKRASLLANVSRSTERAETSVTLLALDSKRGLPTSSSAPTNDERQIDQLGHVSASHRLQFGAASASLKGSFDRARLRYVNAPLAVDDTGLTHTGMVEAEYQSLIGSVLSAVGTSARYESASHPSIESGKHSGSFALYSSASVALGPALLYPAARVDVYCVASIRTFIVPSPRFGANVSLVETGNLRLKLSGGRTFRVPTFNDWYWRGAGAAGNAQLEPESGWSFDAGFVYDYRIGLLNADVEASTFGSIVRDQIEWAPGSDGVWRPENIGRVRSRGLEVVSSVSDVSLGSIQIAAKARYVFTDARDLSDDQSRGLRYTPRNRVTMSSSFGYRGINAGIDGTIVGKRLVTTDGQQSLPRYGVVDVSLRSAFNLFGEYRIGGSVSVLNVLNASYVVVKGYPMPPRSARIALSFDY